MFWASVVLSGLNFAPRLIRVFHTEMRACFWTEIEPTPNRIVHVDVMLLTVKQKLLGFLSGQTIDRDGLKDRPFERIWPDLSQARWRWREWCLLFARDQR